MNFTALMEKEQEKYHDLVQQQQQQQQQTGNDSDGTIADTGAAALEEMSCESTR
jgi:hypothetical protein